MNADPGLAEERTQLAWQRYTFGIAIIAMLALRTGLRGHHQVVAFSITFVLGALAALVQLAGPRVNPHTAVQLALAASMGAAAGSLLLALL